MADSDIVHYHLDLPRHLSDRLETAAQGPRVYRSVIVATALAAWLSSPGIDEVELRFGYRLDRFSERLERIERNGRIALESFALLVSDMLTINAPLAEEDEAGRAIGRDRFTAFVDLVRRHCASAKITVLPEDKNECAKPAEPKSA